MSSTNALPGYTPVGGLGPYQSGERLTRQLGKSVGPPVPGSVPRATTARQSA